MQLETFLADATRRLTDAGITTARLDTLILLEDYLGFDRAHLLAHPEMTLGADVQNKLEATIRERSRHTPLAYIRGKVFFYGRSFIVDPTVLVPRPESEVIIDILKGISDLPSHPDIADIGTGSGCLGITAALEIPDSKVLLSDIDPQALNIARKNAKKLNANVDIIEASLLESAPHATVILANLPYVPDDYPINAAATFEPELALFAGADGLDLYKIFWRQIGAREHKPQYVLTESLASQHANLSELADQQGYSLLQTSGLVQLFGTQDR